MKTYEIRESGSIVSLRLYNVYINNRFTGAYFHKEDALLKIENDKNKYKGLKENIIKNVNYHSNNNNHNCIV